MAQPRPPRPVETKAQGNRRNKIGGTLAAVGGAAGVVTAKTGRTKGMKIYGGALAATSAGIAGVHAAQYYNRNKRNAKTGVRTSNPTPTRTMGRVKRK